MNAKRVSVELHNEGFHLKFFHCASIEISCYYYINS